MGYLPGAYKAEYIQWRYLVMLTRRGISFNIVGLSRNNFKKWPPKVRDPRVSTM
jgi:hypothetical protein